MIFDPLYLVFALPGLLIALLAQFLVWAAYGIYSKSPAKSGLTGLQAAEMINQKEGFGVEMITTPGKLNDYFNPLSNKVNISSENAVMGTVASIAVVAHEFGHVQQKYNASLLFGIRSAMVPAVGFGSSVGYILIIIGLILSVTGLAYAGLILFSLTSIFAILTVPIEMDASRRGLNFIKKYNLIDSSQMSGAKVVLAAAALTYIAALVQSLGQLLYFYLLVSGKRRD